jgi:acyl-CoA reductase-like NAD-dependent aldehyde dehydrogenase
MAHQELTTIFDKQKLAAEKMPFPEVDVRKGWLTSLEKLLDVHGDNLAKAIEKDFGYRSLDETRLLEFFTSFAGIRHSRKKLGKWMRPRRRPISMLFQPAKGEILYQPLGVVGVIVPWNYPLYLAIGPIISALSAGNRVMVKMSESTPFFGELFAEVMKQYFAEDLVTIINGDVEVAKEFTKLPFDHLLYTGSTQVGKLVMAEAAKNLTPVTLELGGKSPTIVDTKSDIRKAAKRIMFGKLVNAGQTCVAPDYVFVPEDKLEEFVTHCRSAAGNYYPDWQNQDYTSIIDNRQYQRQLELVEEMQQAGVRIESLLPGEDRQSDRKMAPRIVINPESSTRVMQEEIFGPLLPVITYKILSEAIAKVNAGERPLALYFFSNNDKNIAQVLKQTHAGGVAINECVLHLAQEELPFGGVGHSGMGHYHGEEGFITFSKAKSVFYQSKINGAGLLTPPYRGLSGKLIKFFMKIA